MIPGWTDFDHGQLSKATPLFYYVLAQSQDLHGGVRFGSSGSAILLKVLGGMIRYCERFISKGKDWQPDP